MKRYWLGVALLLNACVSEPQTPQAKAFARDRGTCETLADMAYPAARETFKQPPLISSYYAGGSFTQVETVRERVFHAPDLKREAKYENSVAKCMARKGWKSPSEWQKGRAAAPAKAAKRPQGKPSAALKSDEQDTKISLLPIHP